MPRTCLLTSVSLIGTLLAGGLRSANAHFANMLLAFYLATGQDPEAGEGDADLWCIDPTKRGDVSAELAVMVEKSMSAVAASTDRMPPPEPCVDPVAALP